AALGRCRARRRRTGRVGRRAGLGSGLARRLACNLVQREIQHIVAAVGINDNLGGIFEYVLHGGKVHAFARDVRRLGVLTFDAGKARGITLGVTDDPGAITLGLLHHARHLALRLGQHPARIGIALVYESFAVLTGLDGVIERRLHLFGRLHVLNRHGTDLNARLVTIEDFLGETLHPRSDFGTARIQDRIHGLLADHFAHGRLDGLAHRLV